ncbi:VCBS repeat-containing protein [uncultured Dokdonia sp.]|uniref:VCBS repeat-containing protein n=1 Tax=Dokdonia sp. R78006 TaxID=3093866 RepID=UPI00260E3EBE|nr:VCBS repeat-containing protein [uncultured Dokdonia sp.]
MRQVFTFIALIFFILSCKDKKTDVRFILKTDSGITFKNDLSPDSDLNILNYLYYNNGAGVATGDFDNDGLIDIYFTSNQGPDKLYHNQSNLTFKDITAQAGISNDTGWTTGVTTVDINNDGLLDIYVSKVARHLKLKGHNLLYVNQGLNNGQLTFKEESKKYQLDLSGLFTQSSFFDYDNDGDLDAYIMGHSLYPNAYFGRGSQRTKVDSINGDKLLENRDGVFIDVSAKANIFSSRIGYGLGLAISDINNDGYPDNYIGNDFFEDDYLYINQTDGTFKEVNTTEGKLGHTSHFSMGNDIADVNNDGFTDILSVDMLPENLETLKSSGTEFNFPIFQNQLRQGYRPQFMQNTLHINQGKEQFSETAFLSGISSTEWSWSPLLADFDNDGDKDIYITNGIIGATNDMDFVNFISNENIQKRIGSRMTDKELPLLEEIPQKKTENYFFSNNGDGTFKNTSKSWIKSTTSFSNGSSYADLDNDGDIDIIVNNVNEQAYLLENRTQQLKDSVHYLKIRFKGSAQNTLGIGAKIEVYTPTDYQYFENYTTRGYLSSVAPELSIGLGKHKSIDSLTVIWPDNKTQTLKNLKTNQLITLTHNASSVLPSSQKETLKAQITDSIIPFKHIDNATLEFSRNPLVPYASTNLSKAIVAGDLNNDGLDDMVALGSKIGESTTYVQTSSGTFNEVHLPESNKHQIHEDIDAVIADINGDSLNDLIIVSGGNEIKSGKPLQPRLYINNGTSLTYDATVFSDIAVNASTVKAIDIDNDGDLDISITSDVIPQQFGTTPLQYILENNGEGVFKDATTQYSTSFQHLGNVRDIEWIDIDNNGYKDAVVVGHWMSPAIFLNDGIKLSKQDNNGLEASTGWFNSLKVADFDNDGDLDIIAGNWGLNSRLTASTNQPLQLYIQDFDSNGTQDPIVTYYYQGEETTIATKDELVKQLPQLNKKYLSYNAFAKARFKEILPQDKLREAQVKSVTQLASMYFENDGNNTFTAHELPLLSQISSVHDILVDDINDDGYKDVLLVGNDYEISTQLGRLDGSQGVLLINDKKGFFRIEKQPKFNILGASRSIQKITISGITYYLIGRNNDTPLFMRKDD